MNNKKRNIGISVGLALLLAVAATMAWAEGGDVVYHACVNNGSGTIFIVDRAGGLQPERDLRLVESGGPAGESGPVGPQGEAGAQGPARPAGPLRPAGRGRERDGAGAGDRDRGAAGTGGTSGTRGAAGSRGHGTHHQPDHQTGQISGITAQDFEALFSDAMLNTAILEIGGVCDQMPAVVINGPAMEIQVVEGYDDAGRHRRSLWNVDGAAVSARGAVGTSL